MSIIISGLEFGVQIFVTRPSVLMNFSTGFPTGAFTRSFVTVFRIVAVAVTCRDVGSAANAACVMGTSPTTHSNAPANERQFMWNNLAN